jgi:hypothetical protein
MASSSRGSRAFAALLFWAGALAAQELQVTPKTLKLVQPEAGPLASAVLTIGAPEEKPRAWSATGSTSGGGDDAWIQLEAASGVTPARVVVSVVGWRAAVRKPGKYTGSITVRAGAASETVAVEWEVLAARPPAPVGYPRGPVGCAESQGYPEPPLCQVLPLPGVLGTPAAGAVYTDPNFGARVRVVAGPKTNHSYSTPSPLSAHNRYLIVVQEDGAFDVVDAGSGRTVVRRTQCGNGCFWDAANDEVFYSLAGAAVLKHDVKGGKTSVLIDYARQAEPLHEIRRGGTGDTSKDNWVSFWAPDEKQLCALDLNSVKTYCGDYGASQRRLPYGDVDFTLIAKGTDKESGKRYVMLIAPPAMGVFSVDLARGVLKPEFRGPENLERAGNKDGKCDPGERCMVGAHIDTMEDEAGVQYLVENQETISPCEVALFTMQLNKGTDMTRRVEVGGGRRRVMTLWRCGPGWVDEHIGCAKSAPYCVISTQSEPRRAGELAQPRATPHAGEIILMRGDGEEVRRIALSRSVLFAGDGDKNYWAAPRAAISSDGTLVVSDSNFGERLNTRVMLIETGVARPAQ